MNSLNQILSDKSTRNIFFFLLLNLSFCIVEGIFGIFSNSLGLTSDAIHMLFDSTAIILGLTASLISKWPSTTNFPSGFGRVEVIAGFVNGVALVIAALRILFQALERLVDPVDVRREGLLWVGVAGLIVNIIGIFAFDHGHVHTTACTSKEHSHHSHGRSNLMVFTFTLALTLSL